METIIKIDVSGLQHYRCTAAAAGLCQDDGYVGLLSNFTYRTPVQLKPYQTKFSLVV